jgi:hypothetical protein
LITQTTLSAAFTGMNKTVRVEMKFGTFCCIGTLESH